MSVRRQAVSHLSCAALAGALAVAILCLTPTRGVWREGEQGHRVPGHVWTGSPSRDTATATAVRTDPVEVVAANTVWWDDDILMKPVATSSGDRWARFEQEYGIKQESASALGRMIQSAKYGLDTMCFNAQEAAKELEFTHDFGEDSVSDLGTGAAQPDYSVPMVGQLGHAQLQSEVTVHDPQTGEAFVGLKLAIPFGPGLGTPSKVPHSRPGRDEAGE